MKRKWKNLWSKQGPIFKSITRPCHPRAKFASVLALQSESVVQPHLPTPGDFLDSLWVPAGSHSDFAENRLFSLQLCSSNLALSILLKGLGADRRPGGLTCYSRVYIWLHLHLVVADWGGDDGHGDREAHPVQRLDQLLLPPCSHRTKPQRWVRDSSTYWYSGLWSWLDCSFGWLLGITYELDLTE